MFNRTNKFMISKLFKRNYHNRVLEHFENPKNMGSLKEDISIGTAIVGAPACGDVIKLQIKVDENTKIIENAKFKTFGCGSAIASSSYMTELIKGKTIDWAMNVSNKDIADYLQLPPVKLHCSLLSEEAIKNAIKNYKNKQTK